jgi:16S rRNA (guanine527-N7)-methyltransferase
MTVFLDFLNQYAATLSSDEKKSLSDYLTLLSKWNKAFNLTAIKKPKEMVIRHVADSLSIIPFLSGDTILDVGSGAGFPGIVLAIVFPDKQFTLLDSNGKKTQFLAQVRRDLSLKNIEIVQARVEAYQPEFGKKFETIVSRAFSNLVDFVKFAAPLLSETGVIIAMKGVYPGEEINALADAAKTDAQIAKCCTVKTHELQVPGLAAKRHAICVRCSKTLV